MERTTGVQDILHSACQYYGLVQENVKCSAKKILASCQEMRWIVMPCSQNNGDVIYYFCSEDLEKAISWIEVFLQGDNDTMFKRYMGVLWESGWMPRSIDITMGYLKRYTPDGELYHKLIQMHYLNERPLSESEMLSAINMSRSSYYVKLGKAATAFGLLFWKNTIPEMRQIVRDYIKA